MEKTKEEFIAFMHQAMHDKNSASYTELYQFLVGCFVRSDTNMDGRVYLEMFDSLIDEAAALPRLYGFAPKSEAMYPSAALRKAARAKMFTGMDTDKSGYITLEEWVKYASTHIAGKVANHLPKDYLGGTCDTVTKEEFIGFIKKAVMKGSEEYQQLYFFLLKCFQQGDVNKTGAVDLAAFDRMIEAAANAPRRFGLAPKTSDMFKTDAARIAKRKEYFTSMDKHHTGHITFDAWLEYAYKHILGKVAAM